MPPYKDVLDPVRSKALMEWTFKSADGRIDCTLFSDLTLTDVYKRAFRWWTHEAKCGRPSGSWQLQLTAVYFLSVTPPRSCSRLAAPCFVPSWDAVGLFKSVLIFTPDYICCSVLTFQSFSAAASTIPNTQVKPAPGCLFLFVVSSIYSIALCLPGPPWECRCCRFHLERVHSWARGAPRRRCEGLKKQSFSLLLPRGRQLWPHLESVHAAWFIIILITPAWPIYVHKPP